ncbi:hypothetical protein ABT010_17495 [Streptomyces sp. NPDC002668]|uniref:hypothetical protein n=1 Tax=Streptomyces sp. NPDC002668 TaxID=3154422 RepID=UPI0033345A1A
MPSVVGLLEQRELAARRGVDRLREEGDRIPAELAAAEQEWQEWQECARKGSPLAERGAIVRRMPEVDHRGISRTIEYTVGKGYNSDALFLFRTVDGEFDFLGQYKQAVS